MEHLRVGPVVKAGGTRIIPLIRFSFSTTGPVIFSSLTPLAVVVIFRGTTVVWETDGRVTSLDPWLAQVPGLRDLIAHDADADAS